MSRVRYSPVYAEYGLSDERGLRPTNPVNITDTFWPQILGEMGVIGFVAYAGFMGSLGWIAWKLARDTEASVTLRVFRLGTGMVLVQAFVESLASPMFHSPPRAYLLYLVVGLVAAAWRPRRIE
jgi:O-antigen ligase